MNRVICCALCMLSCAALAGCGGGQANVTGAVTFDGQPVKDGSIVFVKADSDAREGAVIRDGGFDAKLAPGKYKVEIRAVKVVSKRKQKGFDGKDEELDITEEMIPEHYNTKTELTEEFKSGPNTVKFDLKSKK
jgi:hypothetical protein